FPDERLIPLWQVEDKLLCVGCTCGGSHFILCSVRAAKKEILAYSAMEKKDILQHCGNVAPQEVKIQRAHVVTTNPDRSCLRIVKTRDEVGHGGFARAGCPDQCDNRAF